jgi:alanyl-tRNA synthetase
VRSNVPAKRLLSVVSRRFHEFGFSLEEIRSVIPEDDTTLFVCSGMQNLKSRFANPDGSKHGTIQHCIRTNDLDLVGDGSHLTSFRMIGNFSFGGNDYEISVKMWDLILRDLGIEADEVRVHPDREDHRNLFEVLDYSVVDDEECVWSDGEIGGHCCEFFVRGLEIGNLVNTLGHSTDVGFGLERLLQLLENKNRVDETSLFRSIEPVISDHERTVLLLRENGIEPGSKGRNYVCRRLLRRMLRYEFDPLPELSDWVERERKYRDDRLKSARGMWRRHGDKPHSWWRETFGILPEEMDLVRG